MHNAAEVMELRYCDEIRSRTVRRDWEFAGVWLARELAHSERRT